MNGDLATCLRRLAILMLVAGAVTACGRKGALEPPPKSDAAKGQQGDQAAEPAKPAGGGLSGFRAKKPEPVRPSKTPSFLDPILE